MARRTASSAAAPAHVVPNAVPDPQARPRPPLRVVREIERERGEEVQEAAWADVVQLRTRARAARTEPAVPTRQLREPALLARWAVCLSVLMLIAAATSGQA